MRALTLLAATLLTALWTFAQTPASSGDASRIGLDVAALDSSGKFNLELKQSDFSVYVDGEAQKILDFFKPDAGSNVLLMFDHNDTWLPEATGASNPASSNLWSQMQSAIAGFITALQQQDNIAIAAFEDRVAPILPWRSRSGKPITAKLSEITVRPTAGKNLYGALEWATTQFQGMKGRNVVILFTDGRDVRLAPRWFQSENGKEVLDPLAGLADMGEEAEFAKTLKIVRDSGVLFYIVAPYPDRNAQFAGPTGRDYHLNGLSGNTTLSTDYLKRVQSRLEQIAGVSGSRVFYFEEPAAAAAVYSRLPGALVLGQSYHLDFAPARPPGDGTLHRVEVRIRGGELKAVQSRSSY